MRFLGVEVMSYANYGILIRCYVDQATTPVVVCEPGLDWVNEVTFHEGKA
jgi:hypothetical protein